MTIEVHLRRRTLASSPLAAAQDSLLSFQRRPGPLRKCHLRHVQWQSRCPVKAVVVSVKVGRSLLLSRSQSRMMGKIHSLYRRETTTRPGTHQIMSGTMARKCSDGTQATKLRASIRHSETAAPQRGPSKNRRLSRQRVKRAWSPRSAYRR